MGKVAFSGNVSLRDQFQKVSDSTKKHPDSDVFKIVEQLIDDKRDRNNESIL
jgi:hypothetical protein